MRSLIIFFLIFYSFKLLASISIPGNLTKTEREQTLSLLGLGTSSKILSNPYPLGGYSGFEIGASVEFIDVSDLAKMDNTIGPQGTINYPRLNIGKGFYDDFDAFVHLTPFTENSGISSYGGILRWGAYQSAYLPTNISVLFHTNTTNIEEVAATGVIGKKIFTTTLGADIIVGLSLPHFSLYFGGGQIIGRGRFFGINGTAAEDEEKISNIHTVLGGTIDVGSYYFAAELDRYTESVISLKLGLKVP